jgi:serine protease Do
MTVALAAAAFRAPPPSARADEPAEAMAHATALSKAFRHAAEVATPTVVVVRSETKARKPAAGRRQPGRQQNPFRGTPLEEMFPNGLPEGFEFNMPEGGGPPQSGVGSGVIVDPTGIVLTNNHVVEGADEVTVELSDGREFKAKEIKTDPDSDLAVVRLADAKDLPVARLGDSDKLAIGDWVIAIGTPFDLETTVSAGIISGKGRELSSSRARFLQTDAAINPGNSGGPLVNLAGEVVGINTAIASNSGGYQGIGFAIPVNLAKWVSGQLIARGTVERAYMGVKMGPLDARMATKLGVKDHRKAVLVSDVVPGSPAAAAGVQEFDVITAFDDQPVQGTRSLQEIVERSVIGQPHKLTVLRDGKVVTLSVSVKPLPTDLADGGGGRRRSDAADTGGKTYYSRDFGIEVREKNSTGDDTYEGFAGVLVDRVDEEGIAAAAGVGPGMLIRGVGKTDVTSIAEFAAAIEKESAAAGVLLRVRTPRGNVPLLLQRK